MVGARPSISPVTVSPSAREPSPPRVFPLAATEDRCVPPWELKRGRKTWRVPVHGRRHQRRPLSVSPSTGSERASYNGPSSHMRWRYPLLPVLPGRAQRSAALRRKPRRNRSGAEFRRKGSVFTTRDTKRSRITGVPSDLSASQGDGTLARLEPSSKVRDEKRPYEIRLTRKRLLVRRGLAEPHELFRQRPWSWAYFGRRALGY